MHVALMPAQGPEQEGALYENGSSCRRQTGIPLGKQALAEMSRNLLLLLLLAK